MFNRLRSVGEDFSTLRMATESLIYDGREEQYVRLGGKWYLRSFISDETKNELVSHRHLEIDHSRDLMLLHREAALHLSENVTDDTTQFQRIITLHHMSIAHFLSDAFCLMEMGSLAGSLTLLRSPVEIMIEIQYLKRHPCEVSTYYEKAEKQNEQTQREGKPIDRRRNLRFKDFRQLIKALRTSEDRSEVEDALIDEWDFLSGLVSHVTPELHSIALARPEWSWKAALEDLERVTHCALYQVHKVDQALGHLIDQEEELNFEERLRIFLSNGTSTSPED